MSTHLLTVLPSDPLSMVKELFDTHKFHHIPVVRYKSIVGIISRSDFQAYYSTLSKHFAARLINESLLSTHTAEEIMVSKLAKVGPDDRIAVAVEIFKENVLHALPVVNDDDELVGIVTTHDIIRLLATEKINDADYKTA